MAGDDADLELPIQHPTLDGGKRAHVQVERHIRRLLREQRNGAGDVRLRVARRFVKHRHVQLAAHALVNLVDTAAKGIRGHQQQSRLGIDLFAFRRQGKTGAPTAAQGQAQAGFQVLDVATHRGCADVELQLGRRHAPAIHHRAKHPQQTQIHVADLAQQCFVLFCRRACLHFLATEL